MKLHELTIEHLGDIATDTDLDLFRTAVRRMLADSARKDIQPPLTEEQAVAVVWNDGDWWPIAERILAWMSE